MTDIDLVDIMSSITTFIQNERVRSYNEGVDTMQAENERLRALLLTVACPGGGWTGQPKEIEEATVADCVAAGVCGCIYGKPGRTDD